MIQKVRIRIKGLHERRKFHDTFLLGLAALASASSGRCAAGKDVE
ncbi:hypothetical protein [Pseudomonas luteola]